MDIGVIVPGVNRQAAVDEVPLTILCIDFKNVTAVRQPVFLDIIPTAILAAFKKYLV